MKILVTGASGLVGSEVVKSALRRGHQVFAQFNANCVPEASGMSAMQAELSNAEAFTQEVLRIFPDAIINAAAISNPTGVDAEPELSRLINVSLPERLAQVAHHLSAQMVHISSDMVFDGQRGGYETSDMPDPKTLYGEQKLDAEKAVLEAGDYQVSVLRIPIQTGDSVRGQRSLHEKLFEVWSQGKRPALFTDELRQPCSADNTAEVCVELCERTNLHGIFHWAGREAISRFEMGQQILKHFGLPENLIEATSLGNKPEFKERPRDLTLNIRTLEGKIKTQPQTFADQLEVCTVPKPFRTWYHAL